MRSVGGIGHHFHVRRVQRKEELGHGPQHRRVSGIQIGEQERRRDGTRFRRGRMDEDVDDPMDEEGAPTKDSAAVHPAEG